MESPCGRTLEPDVNGDFAVFHQGNVFQQEANHSFSFPVRRLGISPQPGEVGGQSEDSASLLLIEDLNLSGIDGPLAQVWVVPLILVGAEAAPCTVLAVHG